MSITTKISKKDDEYRVRVFVDGEYQAGADYYTDSRQDAEDTANYIVKHKAAGISDKTTDFAIKEAEEYLAEEADVRAGYCTNCLRKVIIN